MSRTQAFFQDRLDTSQIRTATDNLQRLFSASRDLLRTLGELQDSALSGLGIGMKQTLGSSGLKFSPGACGEPAPPCCKTELGTLSRSVHQGERIILTARLRNDTNQERTFQVEATHPLRNSRGENSGELELKDKMFTLEPGAIGLLIMRVDVTEKYRPCAAYHTRVKVSSPGCRPQYLNVVIDIECEDQGPLLSLCCDDTPPVHRLRYYHHFYCNTPLRQVGNERPAIKGNEERAKEKAKK